VAFKVISCAVSLLLTGACMARAPKGVAQKSVLELYAEEPVGRAPQDKVVIRVDQLQEADQGFLGALGNHPSLAHAMPQPIEIRGTVLVGSFVEDVGTVKLRAPKAKLRDLQVGDRLALGLVARTTCICATLLPTSVKDAELQSWLASWLKVGTCQP